MLVLHPCEATTFVNARQVSRIYPFSMGAFAIRHSLRVPSKLNYSVLDVPASLLSEFGGVGGYEHTSSEQAGIDRVCTWSEARIRGRGQENDPDLNSIHVRD